MVDYDTSDISTRYMVKIRRDVQSLENYNTENITTTLSGVRLQQSMRARYRGTFWAAGSEQITNRNNLTPTTNLTFVEVSEVLDTLIAVQVD